MCVKSSPPFGNEATSDGDLMNPHVFRQYDIRGHAERDFGDAFVRSLGLSLGTFYAKRGLQRIAVGRDCRLSSPRLHEALCAGLLETGVHVVDIGVGPTPLLYFAVHDLDLDGGIHVTGSHNPPDENGFKMMLGKGSLYGNDIVELRSVMESQSFLRADGGSKQSVDPTPAYVKNAQGDIDLGRHNIRFAIDAGSGAGGPLALETMKSLGLDPVALLCEMDGTFPVHHADPTDPETLEMLKERVLEDGLELGFAYDGDADRVGVIDARGEVIWGDKLMIILSRALLAKHPGATIIGEVKCSQTMYDDIAAHGGRGILWKTGHSLIKAKMKEEEALLAGEMSGAHLLCRSLLRLRRRNLRDATHSRNRVTKRHSAPRDARRCSANFRDARNPAGLRRCPEVRPGSASGGALSAHTRAGGHRRRPHSIRRGLGPGSGFKYTAGPRSPL